MRLGFVVLVLVIGSQATPTELPVVHTILGEFDFHRPDCSRLGDRPIVQLADAKMGDRVAVRPALAGDLNPCPFCKPLEDPELETPRFWKGAILLEPIVLRQGTSLTSAILRRLPRLTAVRILAIEGQRQHVEVVEIGDSSGARGDRGWITATSRRHEIVINFANETRRALDILAARWSSVVTLAALEERVVLGMTEEQVRAALGEPKNATRHSSTVGTLVTLEYGRRWVHLNNDRVFSVTDATWSPKATWSSRVVA